MLKHLGVSPFQSIHRTALFSCILFSLSSDHFGSCCRFIFIQEWSNYHLSLWLSSHCLSPQQLFPKLAMCLALIGVHHLMLSILPPISLLYAAVSLHMECSEDMSLLWICYIQHRKGNDFELVISTLYCTGIFLDHPWRPVKVII